jgi:hypothetical protein
MPDNTVDLKGVAINLMPPTPITQSLLAISLCHGSAGRELSHGVAAIILLLMIL